MPGITDVVGYAFDADTWCKTHVPLRDPDNAIFGGDEWDCGVWCNVCATELLPCTGFDTTGHPCNSHRECDDCLEVKNVNDFPEKIPVGPNMGICNECVSDRKLLAYLDGRGV